MYSSVLGIVTRCEWCDTDFHFRRIELEDIVNQVLEFDCKRVIFTGGEPAMQDLEAIGGRLKEYDIHLSKARMGLPHSEIIDWICVSPKDQLYPM